MGKKRAILARMDWDAAFYADMQNDVGFQITEPAEISLDGSKEKSMYGPQSPLYGTTYGDEREFIERWRCKCGRKKSRAYEGEECPFCHSKVEARGSNINICGWISLVKSGAFVIQPLYFRILAQAIGKEFAEIVNCKKKVDTNGIQSELKPGDLDFIPSHPFYGIGIQKFRDRYEEILDYYMHQSNKKNKIHTFELLLAQKDQVFTQHIPVYSTYLRPQSITQDTFYFQGADKMINVIFKLSEQLEDCPDIEWDNFQARLQIKVNMLWDYDFQSMHGKEGIIRDMLLGGSLNYTARNVIVPDPTLRDNEVDLSYHTFRELFKPKIINYLKVYEDIPLSKAEDIWEDSWIFNEKVYDIMMMIVEKENVSLLINRNPTLARIWCRKTYLMAGTISNIIHYVLIAAMHMRATGNVEGIVTM